MNNTEAFVQVIDTAAKAGYAQRPVGASGNYAGEHGRRQPGRNDCSAVATADVCDARDRDCGERECVELLPEQRRELWSFDVGVDIRAALWNWVYGPVDDEQRLYGRGGAEGDLDHSVLILRGFMARQGEFGLFFPLFAWAVGGE